MNILFNVVVRSGIYAINCKTNGKNPGETKRKINN